MAGRGMLTTEVYCYHYKAQNVYEGRNNYEICERCIEHYI